MDNIGGKKAKKHKIYHMIYTIFVFFLQKIDNIGGKKAKKHKIYHMIYTILVFFL